MNLPVKILLSLPALLNLTIIPYNFFATTSIDSDPLFWDLFMYNQFAHFVAIIITIVLVWVKTPFDSSKKWLWTILMALIIPPLMHLVYIWGVHKNKAEY